MGKYINILDDLTINKIAAGEVIERPLNVVKEVVENSIDAGATKIIVEIKKGGKQLIKVIDNGKGIPKDDMDIALERHATSKLRKIEDLEKIYTFWNKTCSRSWRYFRKRRNRRTTRDNNNGRKFIFQCTS